MDCSRCTAALHHHREAHSACSANSHQSELTVTSRKLVEKRDSDARTGRAEWMPHCNRAAHHVESRLINFAHRSRESTSLAPVLRFETTQVRQHLRSEC